MTIQAHARSTNNKFASFSTNLQDAEDPKAAIPGLDELFNDFWETAGLVGWEHSDELIGQRAQ